MKKILLLAGLALSLGTTMKADAQVRINVNIGAPMPVMRQNWYNNDCDYYYMPDQGVYYNATRRMYIWPGGGNWMCGPSLPASYGACTWGNSRYYSFRGRAPFMRHDYYRNYYGNRGRGGRYAYRNDRGWDGRRDGRWNEGRRGGGRWDNNDRGGRGWDNDRGGRGFDGERDGRGGDGNYGNGNNNGGYNGSGNGGYNGNGGGRGGWDRR